MTLSWETPVTADAIQPVPWLHVAVTQYLDLLIQPDWNIVEHGCGGSTLWFAQRAATVTAYDTDAEWLAAVRAKMPANVKLITKQDPPLKAACDLLLIDGARDHRPRWCKVAKSLVKPGGIVVLDNANRPEFVESRNRLRHESLQFSTMEFHPPHVQYAVTEFYRMPGGETTI